MNYEERKDLVHPFFSKAKRITTHAADDASRSQLVQKELSNAYGQQSLMSSEVWSGRPTRSEPSEHSDSVESKQPAILNLLSAGKTERARLHVHSTVSRTTANDRSGVETENLDRDLNLDRRKRRRTVSPDVEGQRGATIAEAKTETAAITALSFVEQLRLEPERIIESTLDTACAIGTGVSASTIAPIPATLDCHVTDETPVEAAAGLIDGDTIITHREGPSPDCVQCQAPTSDTTLLVVPKSVNLLQLKGGQLASSNPRTALVHGKPDTSRKFFRGKKKSEYAPVTILKYPNSSRGRSELGKKIESILHGIEKLPSQSTASQISIKKSCRPPQVTHPFFIAKSSSKGPMESTKSKSKSVATNTEINKSSSRKLTGTPGRIRAQVEAHRATLKSPNFGVNFDCSHTRKNKYCGMLEAPWPCAGTTHIRAECDEQEATTVSRLKYTQLPKTQRKLKNIAVVVHDSENLIWRYAQQLQLEKDVDAPRKPEKLVITGPAIRAQIAKELRTQFRSAKRTGSDSEDDLLLDERRRSPHAALQGLYSRLKSSLTPFDDFQCESQTWTQKYSPTSAAEVLQLGSEAATLRDWLQSTIVTAVDTGSHRSIVASYTAPTKAVKPKSERKKRRRRDGLDEFLVSSDDELSGRPELIELDVGDAELRRSPERRSLIRGGEAIASKTGNAILLSGPSGCGKTAAIYAVAQELGFDVFELNSGSRRSGKDVLEKVGDMTENHLVQQVSKALSANKSLLESKFEPPRTGESDISIGKQGSMKSFFQPAETAQEPDSNKMHPNNSKVDKRTKKHPRQQQRQSLILLEEVDVLFEEDKQFWLTVLSLAGRSKRPIIMTCNDETRVPMESLSLHAVFRLASPSTDLAVDYLLLLAACEGHLLKRLDIKSLYQSRDQDLRASITELNYWCQMGIGDTTGFAWMLERYPRGVDLDERGRKLRVASSYTYFFGLGLIPWNLVDPTNQASFDKHEGLLLEAGGRGELDFDLNLQSAQLVATDGGMVFASKEQKLQLLESIEHQCELYSAADSSTGFFGLQTGIEQLVDATLPELSEKAKSNHCTHYETPIIQTDPPPDYSNIRKRIAVGTFLQLSRSKSSIWSTNQEAVSVDSIQLLPQIEGLKYRFGNQIDQPMSSAAFSSAFGELASPSAYSLAGISQTSLPAQSSFDREFSVLVTELAPYVRSIASHDLHLDQQRLRLSSLLSAGGSSSNKKMRMTRASRSAMEGGKREESRRDRWFGKDLNLLKVMETGGKDWTKLKRLGSLIQESSANSGDDGVTTRKA